MAKHETQWAQYKRRMEMYIADPKHNHRPELPAEECRKYEEAYQGFLTNVYAYMNEKCSREKSADPRFRSWFQRQNARNRFQSSVIRHIRGLYYIPISFELSDGCSVGCDFCCLAAEPLRAVYRYTEEHAGMWKQILEITQKVLGEIAGAGLCYFATEPFDNLDYERFLEDYRERFGYVPQTTTAAAQRNVKRTKDFLKSLGEKELAHAAVRFSVTSLEQLNEIYRSFTAEELYYVELLLNNPESQNCYSRSGRAMQLSESLEGKHFLDTASSACTNGFVVNMAKGTVMLTAVRRPDEKYPKGMRVLEERQFAAPGEYENALCALMERWMPEKMSLEQSFALADYISCQWNGAVLKIKGDKISRSITAGEKEREGLQLFLEKQMPAADVLRSVQMTEYERTRFLARIELLYQSGYLEENQA